MPAFPAAAERPLNQLSINWIVSKRADLMWFIGGALTGYAMILLHTGLHLDMVTVWFLWVAFLDTPHFFGTYLRTYFDKQEFHARRKLLIGAWAWLLAGPTTLGAAYVLHRNGIAGYAIPFTAFKVFFSLWAYWHVVRQHLGIMALYKRKNNDFASTDTLIDKAVLYVGLLAPFLAFIIRHPEARTTLGLSQTMPVWPRVARGDFAAIFSAEYLRGLQWEHYVVLLTMVAVGGLVLTFAFRQFYRWRSGLPVNLPKILFLIALLPLYAYINYSPAILTAPLLAFGAFVTIYHDVQYHAIVWFYSRNRYHRPGGDPKQYGLAVKISKSFGIYALCGVSMALVLRVFGCAFEIHPGCGPFVLTSDVTLFGSFTTRELIYSIVIGVPLHHYFVDQFIWRPSRDKGLRKDLKIATSD